MIEDDWAAWENLRARRNDVLAGLKAGSQGMGAWLTAADFKKMLDVMKVLSSRRRRTIGHPSRKNSTAI